MSHGCIKLQLVWANPPQKLVFQIPSKPELLHKMKQFTSVVVHIKSFIIPRRKVVKLLKRPVVLMLKIWWLVCFIGSKNPLSVKTF